MLILPEPNRVPITGDSPGASRRFIENWFGLLTLAPLHQYPFDLICPCTATNSREDYNGAVAQGG